MFFEEDEAEDEEEPLVDAWSASFTQCLAVPFCSSCSMDGRPSERSAPVPRLTPCSCFDRLVMYLASNPLPHTTSINSFLLVRFTFLSSSYVFGVKPSMAMRQTSKSSIPFNALACCTFLLPFNRRSWVSRYQRNAWVRLISVGPL